MHQYYVGNDLRKKKNIAAMTAMFQTVDKVPAKARAFLCLRPFFWYNTNIRRAVFFMMTKNSDKKREQMIMLCMDDMVPQNHMLRLIDKAIDWTFIYELVEEKYCPDNGRPSMDPVMPIKHAGPCPSFFNLWEKLHPPF